MPSAFAPPKCGGMGLEQVTNHFFFSSLFLSNLIQLFSRIYLMVAERVVNHFERIHQVQHVPHYHLQLKMSR